MADLVSSISSCAPSQRAPSCTQIVKSTWIGAASTQTQPQLVARARFLTCPKNVPKWNVTPEVCMGALEFCVLLPDFHLYSLSLAHSESVCIDFLHIFVCRVAWPSTRSGSTPRPRPVLELVFTIMPRRPVRATASSASRSSVCGGIR